VEVLYERVAGLDWLVECGVTNAAMESTSTYWKGAFYCLEEVMEVWLVNAAHIKAISRRKTDVKDAEWIAQLLECGLLRPSFVPPPDIRRLRMLTRYRVQLMADRTREITRLELMLEDASVKLSSVAASLTSVSEPTDAGRRHCLILTRCWTSRQTLCPNIRLPAARRHSWAPAEHAGASSGQLRVRRGYPGQPWDLRIPAS
jgi:transposase